MEAESSLHSHRNSSLLCIPRRSSPLCPFGHISLRSVCNFILKVTSMSFKWSLSSCVSNRNITWFSTSLRSVLPISSYILKNFIALKAKNLNSELIVRYYPKSPFKYYSQHQFQHIHGFQWKVQFGTHSKQQIKLKFFVIQSSYFR
jgi:hypothetical protein